jgi:adenosine 3'-phospho 5'-phosphosulfate transporter B3
MDQPEAQILGFSVTSWPRSVVLLVGGGGIFVCFLLHGIAHEHLIKHYQLSETFFLTFIQFMGYSALSLPTLFQILSVRFQLKAPIGAYLSTGFCLVMSMGLTNYAAVKLSYATGVLFKSSKLIPVMIGNVFFLKRKPKLRQAISVLLVVVGLIGITLGDFRGKNRFSISGVLAVSTALVCGAAASNLEDKVMSHYGTTQDELISMVYSIGAIVMISFALLTGQLFSGIEKVIENPSCLFFIFCFSVLGALGIQFVYLTMKVFGSLITVMITSVRKALTVALSFLIFRDKVFTVIHGVSIVAIALGLVVNVYEKTGRMKSDEQLLLNEPETDENEKGAEEAELVE